MIREVFSFDASFVYFLLNTNQVVVVRMVNRCVSAGTMLPHNLIANL